MPPPPSLPASVPGRQPVPSGRQLPDAQTNSVVSLQLPVSLQTGVTSESIGQVVVPQTVPAGWLPLSTHWESPVAHEVRPVLHLLGGLHIWFAEQLPQVPEWQTMRVPHDVPSVAGRQAPEPLQAPVWQAASVAPQVASAVPAALFVQVPGVARLQAMQVPHLLLEQQTPSTQLPLVHSVPALQAVPSGFFATHEPETQ